MVIAQEEGLYKPPLQIKVKYMHDDTKRLEQIPQGDWIDLYADKEMYIPHGEYDLIPLGVCIELPKGYEAHLAPRSSLYKNTGLIVTNSIGIIDESYCGNNDEWKLSVVNVGKCITSKDGKSFEGTHVPRGMKIAQFRIMKKMPPVNIIEVVHLNNPDRGGFGSTGN